MSYIPKVGEECEWKPHLPNAKWKTCTVDFIHGKSFCISFCVRGSDGIIGKRVVSGDEFRPIKTEEEKQIEELVKVISQPFGDCEPDESIARAIIEAGYHNQPKVKPLSWIKISKLNTGVLDELYRGLSEQGHIIEAKDDE